MRRAVRADQHLEHRSLLFGDRKRGGRSADSPSYRNPYLFARRTTSEAQVQRSAPRLFAPEQDHRVRGAQSRRARQTRVVADAARTGSRRAHRSVRLARGSDHPRRAAARGLRVPSTPSGRTGLVVNSTAIPRASSGPDRISGCGRREASAPCPHGPLHVVGRQPAGGTPTTCASGRRLFQGGRSV